MLRIVICGIRSLLDAYVKSRIRENLRNENSVRWPWLRRNILVKYCLSSSCTEGCFFFTVATAWDCFSRKGAEKCVGDNLCEGQRKYCQLFSFSRSCRPESSTTAATAALRGATTTAGQGESVVLSGSGFRETTGSPLHLSKM